jgi:hypothetical protein
MKEYIKTNPGNKDCNTYVEYVVQTAEPTGFKWRVVSKKDLFNLNPHDVVQAFEIGRPVELSVSLKYK